MSRKNTEVITQLIQSAADRMRGTRLTRKEADLIILKVRELAFVFECTTRHQNKRSNNGQLHDIQLPRNHSRGERQEGKSGILGRVFRRS